MTMEQILEKIKQDRGENALWNSSQLLGLFTDYSKNQLRPQANALRVFLDCRGNERILNLRNAPQHTQQIELHHLMQEMINDHNMQRASAAEVCSIFWRVAAGTEPPSLAEKCVPDKEPISPAMAPNSTDSGMAKNPANSAQQSSVLTSGGQTVPHTDPSKAGNPSWIIQHFKGMTLFARVTFLIGLFGVLVLGVHVSICAFKLLDGSFTTYVHGANKAQVCMLFVTFLAMLSGIICLWKKGFDYRGILGSMPPFLGSILWAIPGLVIYVCCPIAVYMVSPTVMVSPSAPVALKLIYIAGMLACHIFCVLWYVRRLFALRWITIEKRRKKAKK